MVAVWALPLLVLLTVAAWRRRSWSVGLAALLTATVFSAAAALPSTWGPLGGVLSADAYVWCGAAVVVGMALFLHQEDADLRSGHLAPARSSASAIS
jgi:hypothetical protein